MWKSRALWKFDGEQDVKGRNRETVGYSGYDRFSRFEGMMRGRCFNEKV